MSKGELLCSVLYCIVLYCIVLYCVVLHCIVLYCFVLYCIVLCVLLRSAIAVLSLYCVAFVFPNEVAPTIQSDTVTNNTLCHYSYSSEQVNCSCLLLIVDC